jgi:hypothetical protein
VKSSRPIVHTNNFLEFIRPPDYVNEQTDGIYAEETPSDNRFSGYSPPDGELQYLSGSATRPETKARSAMPQDASDISP